MAQRYNPPPGWPVPTEGWKPAFDWRPDPEWPPAPEGWVFWQKDPAAPSTPITWRINRRYVGLAVAVGLIGAGMAGAGLTKDGVQAGTPAYAVSLPEVGGWVAGTGLNAQQESVSAIEPKAVAVPTKTALSAVNATRVKKTAKQKVPKATPTGSAGGSASGSNTDHGGYWGQNPWGSHGGPSSYGWGGYGWGGGWGGGYGSSSYRSSSVARSGSETTAGSGRHRRSSESVEAGRSGASSRTATHRAPGRHRKPGESSEFMTVGAGGASAPATHTHSGPRHRADGPSFHAFSHRDGGNRH
jgi:hypothetical protein